MSERNIIVYAGGFALPDRNASAQRALENARLFRSLGYEVVLIGQLPDTSGTPVHETQVGGFRCFNIHSPDAARHYGVYKRSAAAPLAVMDRLEANNIYAFLGYNYPAAPFARVLRYARAHGIRAGLELTEWYGWEGPGVLKNLEKLWDTEYRIRLLAARAGNVLCTSDWGADLYGSLNALTLPWIVDETAAKWAQPAWPRVSERRRFVYVGVPGRGLVKDRLNLAIEALGQLAREGVAFDFQVAGITVTQILESFPALARDIEALDDRITFHGRLPHSEALGLLKSADFSFFVRPSNRVSRFGFPTKLAEAFACGVPTITNPTSDIPKYVRNGETGILLEGIDKASIAAGLLKALQLSDDEMAGMKERCGAANPFSPANFREPVREFLARMR